MLEQWSRNDDLDELDWEPGDGASTTPLRAPLVDAGDVDSTSRFVAILAVAVIAAVIAAVFLDGSGPVPPAAEPSTPAAAPRTPLPPTTVPAEPSPTVGPGPTDAGVVRPAPPVDHDPIVSGRPGGGPLLPDAGSDLSVVYVNTLERPTVIDFDTGTYREVLLAETRAGDWFRVEHGAVVGRPGSRNLGVGSARAVSFHVYRTFADPPGDRAPEPGVGPVLCLDEAACAALGWRANEFAQGADTVTRLDTIDAPEVAAFLTADRWTTDGRWWVAGDVRIPAPAGGDVWVVHQPEN